MCYIPNSKRLGSDAAMPDPDAASVTFDAHVLVHEIQLMTNQYVAENLLGTYDQTTPLLRYRWTYRINKTYIVYVC